MKRPKMPVALPPHDSHPEGRDSSFVLNSLPGWNEVKLDDILQRVRKPVDVQPTTLYREMGIRSHGKGLFYKEERTGESLGDKAVFWVEPDCFVVNIVFAWEQAVAKTTASEMGMIASHRFPMYKPVTDKLDLDYLLYFFLSPRGKHLLGLASPGGAGRNKTLGQEGFLNIVIPLPPLPEQRRIAALLGTWDTAIALTEQLIAAKQKLKKGLMQVLLTGRKRFKTGTNWTRLKLGDLLDIQYGKAPKEIKNSDGKFIVFGTGGVVGKTNTPLSKEPAIIIGRKGTITQPQLAKEPFWAIDTTFFCTPKRLINIAWIYYALNMVNFESYNEGSTIPSLSRTTLNKIELAVPTQNEQNKIAEVLLACDTETTLLTQKLAALRAQKKGLMQQLLTGKVRVEAA